MAWAILKGLGATAEVSQAEIDATGRKVVAADNCKVSNVKFENGTLTFDRLDDALPMPIDDRAEAALKLSADTGRPGQAGIEGHRPAGGNLRG